MAQTNIIYHQDCVAGMAEHLEDECVDLVVADPPYFKVVGEKWDYRWRTEEDYLSWSETWIAQAVRALRMGGQLLPVRLLPHAQPAAARPGGAGLELRQQIVLNKGMQSVSGRATRGYKMFPNATESILFLYKDPKPFVRQLLKARQQGAGADGKGDQRQAGGTVQRGRDVEHLHRAQRVQAAATQQVWDKLREILQFDLPYEKIRQTFHPQLGLTDVWDDVNFYEEERFHPTQKPQKALERLILASSDRGDLVLDPFMGGGSPRCAAGPTAAATWALRSTGTTTRPPCAGWPKKRTSGPSAVDAEGPLFYCSSG